MVNKSDLLYTYVEVRDAIKKAVTAEFESVKNRPIHERKAILSVWVKELNTDLVKDVFIHRLETEFVGFGWSTIEISKKEERNGTYLHIYLK